ncbi:endonuclease/exonuclease/phosphatase family protein [Desulfopila inferna]|uniref:endonuclease/exonuclease/phosphatase family protein n=1 Tax=Desulfopila inferna TaxID=468528 RepID=UPI00196672E4|nr:endonuclease/exonuclease/phosphatase family protein [Desulfopila inferna]MBM9606374.1 endonuclease/exonuclease/phosphatase family protein [Desulfopila inferna]
MRFLVYNIRYATGHNNGYHLPFPYSGFFRSTRRKLDEIIDFIGSYAPDVIGLIEVDSGSYRSGRSCQAEAIAQALGYSHLVETKYGDKSLTRRVPVLNKQSNALLTRQDVVKHRYHYFDEGIKRLVIEAEFDSVVFFIVHLSLKFRHRQNQLQRLHQLVKSTNKPVVIGGDFNTFWGSNELELFLAATGLCSANPDGLPSHPSHAPHRQIDFILHSSELEVSKFAIPDVQLSDHSPLICDLDFTESFCSIA